MHFSYKDIKADQLCVNDFIRNSMDSTLKDKVILITGGTGSFGKKCVEVILKEHRPKKVIVFSRDELKQFDMAQVFPTEEYPIRYFLRSEERRVGKECRL